MTTKNSSNRSDQRQSEEDWRDGASEPPRRRTKLLAVILLVVGALLFLRWLLARLALLSALETLETLIDTPYNGPCGVRNGNQVCFRQGGLTGRKARKLPLCQNPSRE